MFIPRITTMLQLTTYRESREVANSSCLFLRNLCVYMISIGNINPHITAKRVIFNISATADVVDDDFGFDVDDKVESIKKRVSFILVEDVVIVQKKHKLLKLSTFANETLFAMKKTQFKIFRSGQVQKFL